MPTPVSPRVVAVTGAFGFLGRHVLQMLEADATIERIVVVDIRGILTFAQRQGESTVPVELLAAHPKLSVHTQDLTDVGTDADLAEIFVKEGVDTVLHLAFLSSPTHASEMAHELETIGTLYLTRAVTTASVRRLVSISSAMTYGAHPTNPAYLHEDYKSKARIRSRFLKDRIDAERQVLATNSATTTAAVARLGAFLGKQSRHFWARYLKRKIVPTVLGYDPLFQLMHVSDVARSLLCLMRTNASGPFNIVGSGVLPLSHVIGRLGRQNLPVPATLARSILHATWSMQVSGMPPGFVDFLRWSWVCDARRAEAELGFTPRWNIHEVLDLVRREENR